MFRKKGQGEAAGLLVIVILLIFIGFIYLRFSMRGSGSDYSNVRESMQARGLLLALLQLETREERFKDGIANCYYNDNECLKLQQRIKSVFGNVLNQGQDYHIILQGEDKVLADIGDCKQGIVSTMPFTLEGVFYEGRLTLCVK